MKITRTMMLLLLLVQGRLSAFGQQTSFSATSFQATLTGSNGLPLPNGTNTLVFRFYDAVSGGNQIGSAVTNANVQVLGGVATSTIQLDPAVFNGQTRYVGIVINTGPELVPRMLVTAVPYAAFSQATSGMAVDTNGAVTMGPNNSAVPLNLVANSENSALNIRNADPGVGAIEFVQDGADFSYPGHAGTGAAYFAMLAPFAWSDGWAAHPDATLLYWNGSALSFGSPDGGHPVFNVGIGTRTPQAQLDVVGMTRTHVIQITGGSDIAEPFDISAVETGSSILPGTVVVIDPSHDEKLTPCTRRYDTAVAGVISGAKGLAPGMIMKAEGRMDGDGELPVAMTGRVWCWVDATTEAGGGPVKRGDRLTTSATPGHAMRVADETKAPGAVIGKAMSELHDGRGLVLVLVNLQ